MSDSRSIDVHGEARSEPAQAPPPNFLPLRTFEHGAQGNETSPNAEDAKALAKGLAPSSADGRGTSDDLTRSQIPPVQTPIEPGDSHLSATEKHASSHKQDAHRRSFKNADGQDARSSDAAMVKSSTFRLWWLEIVACLLFVIAIFAVVATLYPHQDKPLPDWVRMSRLICGVVSDLPRQRLCRSQTTYQTNGSFLAIPHLCQCPALNIYSCDESCNVDCGQ